MSNKAVGVSTSICNASKRAELMPSSAPLLRGHLPRARQGHLRQEVRVPLSRTRIRRWIQDPAARVQVSCRKDLPSGRRRANLAIAGSVGSPTSTMSSPRTTAASSTRFSETRTARPSCLRRLEGEFRPRGRSVKASNEIHANSHSPQSHRYWRDRPSPP